MAKSEQGKKLDEMARRLMEMEDRVRMAVMTPIPAAIEANSEQGAQGEAVGMTSSEIAGAVGQTTRSVRMWVSAIAEKNSAIAEKLSSSSPRYPARYTLAESCLIIEEGLGKAAADVYRTNAANAELERRKAGAAPAPGGLTESMLHDMLAIYGKAEAAKRIDHLIGYKEPVALPAPRALPPLDEIPPGQRLLNLQPPRHASSFLSPSTDLSYDC